MRGRNLVVVTLLVLFSVLCALGGQARADTVAYWRFEDPNSFNDSVGENHLTNSGVSTSEGGLWDPVPQTDDRNYQKAYFDGSSSASAANIDAWWNSTFTIEAMVRPSNTATQPLVSVREPFGKSSWSFNLDASGTTTKARLQVWDESGSPSGAVLDGLTIESDKTYALAAVFDDGSDEITLYGRERNSTSWTSETETLVGFGGLQNSNADLMIGEDNLESENQYLTGYMDEIRFSDTTLEESQLLATPEPGTTCLAILAAGAGVFAVWRKKRKSGSDGEEAE